MLEEVCSSFHEGGFESFGVWGWVGLILFLIIWFGSIGGTSLLVYWILQRVRPTSSPAV